MRSAASADGEPHSGADNYELGVEIARGGMGSILEAVDRKLTRTVAVKVLMPDSDADEGMKQRFLREATVLAHLEHPNIVPIHDIVWEGGGPLFYTMKLVKGRTLERILAEVREGTGDTRREYPLDRLLPVLLKVCDAVAFAHSRGILHRDLKPGNIMVGEFGEVLVMDWGVAKFLSAGSEAVASVPVTEDAGVPAGATRFGAVIGTPHFMSPEQASGAIAEHDERSDIFSLGAILYAMLTLRPPVDGTTMGEVLRQIAAGQIAPLLGSPTDAGGGASPLQRLPSLPHCPGGRVPAALSAVAMKALALEKSARFQSVREFAADIERYQGGFATSAERAGLLKEFQLLVFRHKSAAGLLGVLLLVSLGFLIKVMASERRALADKETARKALAHSSVSLAEAALREGNGLAVRAALGEVPPELRDGTWGYLLGESDTSQVLAVPGIEEVDDLAAHPARTSVFAAAVRGGELILFDAKTGTRGLVMRPGFPATAPEGALRIAFSKAGDRIAIGRTGGRGIVVHDAGDGRKLAEWDAPASALLEFSPDDTLLVQSSADRQRVNMWNTADGTSRWGHTNEYHNARFTPDGEHVVNYCWAGGLQLLEAETGASGVKLPGNYFQEFAPQPAGNLLVAVNPLGFVRSFDMSDGRVRFEFQPNESATLRVQFLPGGERFLTAATLADGRQALQIWDAAGGRALQALNGGRGEIRALAVHPLSGELIVAGQDIRVWDAGGLSPVRIIRSNNAHPSAVFWGGDDVLFAPGDDGHSADLLDLSGATAAAVWRSETGDHGQPSVSADGRRAAIGRYNSAHGISVLEQSGPGIKQIAVLHPPGALDYVRLSPAGDRLAVVYQGFSGIQVQNVSDGKQPVPIDGQNIVRFSDVAWLSGGKTLAALVTMDAPRSTPGSVEQLVLWDAATGRRLRSASRRGVSDVMCASPEGTRFAESGADRNVRIRDGTTLRILSEFRVHNAPITALAWHPTRPILATASEDLVIRLWNLDDGTRLEELRGPLSPPSVLSFSPDGHRLATAARDGVARIWEPHSLAAPAAR